MGLWQTIRIILLISIILINLIIGISTYYTVEKYDCQRNWQSDYLIYSSIGIGVNAFINMIFPFNKYMANFFLIGSIYALAVLLAISTQIYCLYKYESIIKKCKHVSDTIKTIFRISKKIGLIGYICISITITFILLYS
jgi:hypothetical protein